MFTLSSCSSGVSNSNENILIITDIHLDPFNSCGTSVTSDSKLCVLGLVNESNPANWHFADSLPNNYGEETNNTFFINGLTNLTTIVKGQNISKIFVTGDLLSHDFPTQFESYVPNGTQSQHTELAINTMNYVLYKISQAVPNAKIYYIFGNNDTDQSDYSYPTSDFMKLAASRLNQYMAYPEIFKNNFANGGYYAMPLNQNVDILALNMNPLTVENEGNIIDDNIAESQFVWLENQLYNLRSRGKKAIILQHEPFGANVFDIADGYKPDYNIQPKYGDRYQALYGKYNDVIQNYYFGHYHMEDYMVVESLFAMSTLGFSVDFNNNPGFKIIQLSDNGSLVNFTTYYSDYNLSNSLQWSELYSFQNTYGINATDAVNFFFNISRGGNSFWSNYVKNYSGGATFMSESKMPINSESNWAYYECQIKYSDMTKYLQCVEGNEI
ncbi:MAG: metallophosphoesterase [Burkholderiales bacterium]|nr:metallophosphoesterase [Burkholderiales bacterium]